jgi:hypothetical protein
MTSPSTKTRVIHTKTVEPHLQKGRTPNRSKATNVLAALTSLLRLSTFEALKNDNRTSHPGIVAN